MDDSCFTRELREKLKYEFYLKNKTFKRKTRVNYMDAGGINRVGVKTDLNQLTTLKI